MDASITERRLASLALPLTIAAALAACSPDSVAPLTPVVDLRPPELLEAGPSGARSFAARFDEAVALVPDSLGLEPEGIAVQGAASGSELTVAFEADQSPGLDYRLSGEVDDSRGNRTRFLVRFSGWNENPPAMRISEVQTGKNGSQTRPHRDYVEMEVLKDGNIGGEELAWTSSVKTMTYRFPGIEVEAGDFIVLHLAPEGIEAEVDELGADTTVSGGIDATVDGRDLWSGALALPDESGAMSLRSRPGGPVVEGFFYASDEKSGAMGDDKLAAFASDLARSGAWPAAGQAPTWDDAFKWKPSSARSISRCAAAAGAASWYVTLAGGQSPGAVNPPPPSVQALALKRSVKSKR